MGTEMNDRDLLTITVTLEDRPDGGIRVSSSDLVGLILSGADKEAIIGSIAPAIKALLEYSGLIDVRVHHSKSMAELANGDNPQDVDMHVQHFVVEYKQAA